MTTEASNEKDKGATTNESVHRVVEHYLGVKCGMCNHPVQIEYSGRSDDRTYVGVAPCKMCMGGEKSAYSRGFYDGFSEAKKSYG